MAYFIMAVILTICIAQSYGSTCNSKTRCLVCTAKASWISNFRWCPRSNTCHATGAILTNPCSTEEDIKDPESCSDPIDDDFQSALAYNYAQLSAVSYSNAPGTCIGRLFHEPDFQIFEKIGKKCNQITFFYYKECFAYTAVSKTSNTIVVTFRGTAGGLKQLYDEFWSTLSKPKQPFMIGGMVQNYFYNAFDQLYKCVKVSVEILVSKYPHYNVVVTGHSLGGALASLAAAALVHEQVVPANKMALYTFGSPRVGDKDYADAHSKLITTNWRLVLYKDIVPQLPPLITPGTPYHHGVEVFYPRIPMHINSTYVTCTGESDDCSNGIFTGLNKLCLDCIESHGLYYTSISIGTYCDSEILKRSRRAVIERAEFWSHFNEETCTRVETPGHNQTSNSAAVIDKYWGFIPIYTMVLVRIQFHKVSNV